jgi:hypothetical protein
LESSVSMTASSSENGREVSAAPATEQYSTATSLCAWRSLGPLMEIECSDRFSCWRCCCLCQPARPLTSNGLPSIGSAKKLHKLATCIATAQKSVLRWHSKLYPEQTGTDGYNALWPTSATRIAIRLSRPTWALQQSTVRYPDTRESIDQLKHYGPLLRSVSVRPLAP